MAKTPTEKAVKNLTAEVLDDESLDLGPRDDEGSLIPEELVFETPKRVAGTGSAAQEVWLDFEVDGQNLRARKPKSGAWSLILAGFSNTATASDRTNAILQFVGNALDEPSRQYVLMRLQTYEDDFEMDTLSRVVAKLVQLWAPNNRADRRAAARAK